MRRETNSSREYNNVWKLPPKSPFKIFRNRWRAGTHLKFHIAYSCTENKKEDWRKKLASLTLNKHAPMLFFFKKKYFFLELKTKCRYASKLKRTTTTK